MNNFQWKAMYSIKELIELSNIEIKPRQMIQHLKNHYCPMHNVGSSPIKVYYSDLEKYLPEFVKSIELIQERNAAFNDTSGFLDTLNDYLNTK